MAARGRSRSGKGGRSTRGRSDMAGDSRGSLVSVRGRGSAAPASAIGVRKHTRKAPKSRQRGTKRARSQLDPSSSTESEEEQVDTRVPWGTVCACELCGIMSDQIEDWGRTVRIKRAAPETGVGEQPIGDACGPHHMIWQETSSHMKWRSFVRKYIECEDFAKDIDEGLESYGLESSELPFPLSSVHQELESKVQLASPAFIPLTYQQYRDYDKKNPEEAHKLRSTMLPDITGSGNMVEYWLAGDPADAHPRVRSIITLGGKLSEEQLKPSSCRHRSQGAEHFAYHCKLRARKHPHSAFWENSEAPSLDTLEGTNLPEAPGTGAAASGPKAPVGTKPPDTMARPGDDDLVMQAEVKEQAVPNRGASRAAASVKSASRSVAAAAAAAAQRRAPSSSPPASSPQNKMPRTMPAHGNHSRCPAPSPLGRPQVDESPAPHVGPDDSISQVGSDSRAFDDEEPADDTPESKSAFWIYKNDLQMILSGKARGVQEHQADLYLKKMQKWEEENPSDSKYQGDMKLLAMHMRKVTLCKKLRSSTISNLSEEDYTIVLKGLGDNVDYPHATRCLMLTRRVAIEKRKAFEQSELTHEEWMGLVSLFKPRTTDKSKAPVFSPWAPTLASTMSDPEEAITFVRKELIDCIFVPLIDNASSAGFSKVLAFTKILLEVFENFWEPVEDIMQQALTNIVQCASVVQIICVPSSVPEPEFFKDLDDLHNAAVKGGKGIKGIVSAALVSCQATNERLELLMTAEKHIVVAGPFVIEHTEKLVEFSENDQTEEHITALKEISDFLSQWEGKLPGGVTKPLMDDARAHVMSTGLRALELWASEPSEPPLQAAGPDSLQKMMASAVLAFSLDEAMAVLRDDLANASRQVGERERANTLGSFLAQLAPLMESFANGLGDEGQGDPIGFVTGKAKQLHDVVKNLKGTNVDTDLSKEILSVINIFLTFCEKNPEQNLDVVLQCCEAFSWLDFPGLAEKIVWVRSAMKLRVGHKHAMRAPDDPAEDMAMPRHLYKQALVVKRALLDYDTSCSELQAKDPEVAMLDTTKAYYAEAKNWVETVFSDEVKHQEAKLRELIGQVEPSKWAKGLAKNCNLEKVHTAWRDSSLTAKQLEAQRAGLAQALRLASGIDSYPHLQSPLALALAQVPNVSRYRFVLCAVFYNKLWDTSQNSRRS